MGSELRYEREMRDIEHASHTEGALRELVLAGAIPVDLLPEGVLVVDGGRVVHANDGLARMLGVERKSLEGRLVSELFADADGRPTVGLLDGDTLRLRDDRGRLVPISLREIGSGVFLATDRSRERRLEREIWRLSGREGQSGRTTGLPADPHREALGMIEHEIRTATTVVRGYTRMLLDGRVGELEPSQRGFLGQALRATERISSLLDNLLEMASLDCGGELRIRREPMRLHPVARAAAEALRPLLEARHMVVRLDLDAESDAVLADPERMEQVFGNLLSNAIKFAPERSPIHVRTELVETANGDAIRITIEDEGPGIAPEEAASVFEPFVQGSAARDSHSGGVGLGLAICRRILASHGGEIEVVPDIGRGAFRMLLPLDTRDE